MLNKIENRIKEDISKHLSATSKLAPERVASEYLSEKRIGEQIEVLVKYSGDFSGKNILEVGSGYGMFVAYSNKYLKCKTIGLEPSSDEYSTAYDISKELLEIYGVDEELIIRGEGEKMPFDDNYFDVVYSSNVLEHVKNPKKVIDESVRVLKPSGVLQFVVPNFGSFWEGHYCVFWIPYLTHSLGKFYLKLLKKNSDYLSGLQLVDYFSLKKFLKPYIEKNEIEILTWGEEIFRERMLGINFTSWAGLSKIKSWLDFLKKIGALRISSYLLILAKAYTPIIITIRKK